MVERYPHYLFAAVSTADTVDQDGNYTSVSVSYELLGRCRETRSGGQRIIVGGQEYLSQHTVYASGVSVTEGREIVVSEDSEMTAIRCRGVVRSCHTNQLHTKILL